MDYSGLLYRTALGVLLGWIVWRGKSIFPAMLAHFTVDASVFGYYSWLVHTKGMTALHTTASVPHLTYLSCLALIGGTALLAAGWWLISRDSASPSAHKAAIPLAG
jgi:hypothetical protein